MESCKCINLEEIKELKAELKDLGKRTTDLESKNELQKYQHGEIMKALSEMKQDLKEMKETPAKRWDLVIVAIITGGASYLVNLIFNK